jgi:uroporphyrinogen decarboxylase
VSDTNPPISTTSDVATGAQEAEAVALPDAHPLRRGTSSSPLIRAARGQAVEQVPVWFMRQAGRSLPEYRELRRGVEMLTACNTTDLISEITLQPVRRHGVDAAILFSDIVVPLWAAGIDVDIKAGVGPVVAEPFETAADLDRIGDLEDVSQITAAIGDITGELGATPLIGFCGAPFTLASYLIEGGPSRDHARTKAMMWSNPQLWSDLLSRLSRLCGEFLRAQVVAGVSAVQVFDSWAGALARVDYEQLVLPHTCSLLDSVAEFGVPRIHFGVGTGELLSTMAVSQCEVVGIDHRVSLSDGISRIGPDHAVQGNIDPALLFAGAAAVQEKTDAVIKAGRAAKGHIFNLGHGVLPNTDPAALTDLVSYVHEK